MTDAAPGAVVAAMRRALALAHQVRGTTSPNPPVGAVVLDCAGAVVGVGATAPPGGPHAEIGALAEAGERARGGTLVVTLEPCTHHGRTSPCTDALLTAGIAAVHYAVDDPNPQAAGGATALRAAGVTVYAGLLAAEVASGPLRAWLHRQRTGRPHVTWKFAATLDGRSAAADGTSQWITSPQARADVHELRAASDAILIGTGTALADDPQLTARWPDGTPREHQPLRVVAGRRPLPAGSRLREGEPAALLLPGGDPQRVLAVLDARNVVDVLLEGGPTLAGAFLGAGCIDRVIAYQAPALLGDGPPALGPAAIGTIAEALRLRIEDVAPRGPDLRICAVPVR